MSIRVRWIVIAVFFGFNVAAACSAGEWIGAAACFVLVLFFLGVGIWDSNRPSHYTLADPEETP